MNWLAVVQLGIIIPTVLVVLSLVGIFVRRRWLSSRGAVFDCALRVNKSSAIGGWAAGFARYEGEVLTWYRVFALTWRPRMAVERRQINVVGRRDPEPSEALELFSASDRIVVLEAQGRHWELAMTPESITGLLSWLEGASPAESDYR